MSEAVIVDAVRTPIGRAFKGSLKDFRADELAAVPLKALVERNPGVDFAQTDDVMMGAASSFAEQAYNVGRNATLLAGFDHHVPALHGQPLLRLVAADAAHGLPRRHGGRGRPVRRRGRGVRLAHRAGRGHGRRVQERQARRLGRLALRRLHPDGADRRERRRALQGHPRAAGRVGRDLAEPRGRRRPERPLRSRDRPRHARRRHRGQPRRRPAPGHDDGGPGQPQAGLPARRHRHRRQLVPAQRRRGRRARHERRARRGARPDAAGADRRLEPSRPSARRSWASARSPPSRRCSSRPA